LRPLLLPAASEANDTAEAVIIVGAEAEVFKTAAETEVARMAAK
jgi:hypothetical protein